MLYACILVTQLLIAPTLTSVVQYRYVYGIWVFIGYSCLGAHFVLFPTVIMKLFGLRSGAQLASLIYVAIGLQSIFSVIASYFLLQTFGVKVYDMMMFLATAMTLVSFALLTVFKETKIQRLSELKESLIDT